MSEVRINAALVSAAQAALVPAIVPATAIAWEGKAFTPPQGKWAAVFRLPAGNDVASLGEGGQDDATGVFQIDVNDKEDSGTALLKEADKLKAYFVAGRSFTYQGQCVHVMRCDISAIRRVDGWLRISASIYYSSYTTRPAF